MKLIKVFAASIIAGLSLSITSVAYAACAGTAANLGTGNGCYEATHPQYVILGTVTDLDDVATTINYTTATGGGLDSSNETLNNVSGTTNIFMTGDTTAIEFVDGGTVGLRANSDFQLTLTVPVLSNGTICTPAFAAQSQTDIGVTANFSISLTDGDGTEVASYSVSDGETSDTGALVAQLSCPSVGLGDGTILIELSPSVTTEYTLTFDIGFEIDGAKDASLAQVGADGEPAADTYEMTLGLAAAAI